MKACARCCDSAAQTATSKKAPFVNLLLRRRRTTSAFRLASIIVTGWRTRPLLFLSICWGARV